MWVWVPALLPNRGSHLEHITYPLIYFFIGENRNMNTCFVGWFLYVYPPNETIDGKYLWRSFISPCFLNFLFYDFAFSIRCFVLLNGFQLFYRFIEGTGAVWDLFIIHLALCTMLCTCKCLDLQLLRDIQCAMAME